MKRVAILTPKSSDKAETFIRNHINYLPFEKVIIYGGNKPYLVESEKESFISKNIFVIKNKIRKILKLNLRDYRDYSLIILNPSAFFSSLINMTWYIPAGKGLPISSVPSQSICPLPELKYSFENTRIRLPLLSYISIWMFLILKQAFWQWYLTVVHVSGIVFFDNLTSYLTSYLLLADQFYYILLCPYVT